MPLPLAAVLPFLAKAGAVAGKAGTVAAGAGKAAGAAGKLGGFLGKLGSFQQQTKPYMGFLSSLMRDGQPASQSPMFFGGASPTPIAPLNPYMANPGIVPRRPQYDPWAVN